MLFVLPSDMEGLSLALLEAMGAGLCVLASDIPVNRELVSGAGYLFKPGDVADLGKMMRLLTRDNQLREAAGKAAKRRIQEQYQWSNIAAQIEHVYLEMAGWEEARVGGADTATAPATTFSHDEDSGKLIPMPALAEKKTIREVVINEETIQKGQQPILMYQKGAVAGERSAS